MNKNKALSKNAGTIEDAEVATSSFGTNVGAIVELDDTNAGTVEDAEVATSSFGTDVGAIVELDDTSSNKACLHRLKAEVSTQSFFGLEDAACGKDVDFERSFSSSKPSFWVCLPKAIFLVAAIYSIVVHLLDDYPGFFFAYYTNWAMLFTMFYFIFSLLLAGRLAPTTSERDNVQGPSRSTKIAWVLYSLATPMEMGSLFYWAIGGHLHRSEISEVIANLLAHGGLFVFLLLDGMLINRIPIRLKHLVFPWTTTVVYGLWSFLHSRTSIGNPYPYSDDDAIYDNLNWNADPVGMSLYSLGVIFIVLPLMYILCWLASLFTFPIDFSGKNRRFLEKTREEEGRDSEIGTSNERELIGEWRPIFPGDNVQSRWAFRIIVLLPVAGIVVCLAADSQRPLAWSCIKAIALLWSFVRLARKLIAFLWWWGSVIQAAKNSCTESHGWTHLVLLPSYRDSFETIQASLFSLASQSVASSIIAIVSFEEKSPDIEEKIERLEQELEGKGLGGLHFTVHPSGIPGEIPGMNSNSTWAAFELMRMLDLQTDTNSEKLDKFSVTICDCDCVFHPRYFQTVTRMLESEKDVDQAFYQASIFFYLNMASGNPLGFWINRWFSGGIAASTIERNHTITLPCRYKMLSPLNAATVTLRTGLAAGFLHPGRVPTDIDLYHRCLVARRGDLRARMVPCLVYTEGATADTLRGQFVSLVTQWQRWYRGPYQEIDNMLVDSFHRPFRDLSLLVLWWVQFLYWRAWIIWEIQIHLYLFAVTPTSPDAEIVEALGWVGKVYVSLPAWAVAAMLVVDVCCTVFFNECFANWVMKRAGVTGLNSGFRTWETAIHVVLAPLIVIPVVVIQWIAFSQEFFGNERHFEETPKQSMSSSSRSLVKMQRTMSINSEVEDCSSQQKLKKRLSINSNASSLSDEWQE